MRIATLVVAAVLLLLGIRSLVRWFSTHFEAASATEQFLYSLHVTARVGIWFALGVAFLGYALVDDPQEFTWFVAVPIALAATQLLTSVLLSRSPSRAGQRRGGRLNDRPDGKPSRMMGNDQPPGPLEEEKSGETSEPGAPQPEAAEVESARLLANQARDRLQRRGLSDEQIQRLADDYIALDRGEDLEAFIGWAESRRRSGSW